MTGKDSLTRIKSGAWARGLSLARLTVTAGARAAGHAVGSVFAGEQGRGEAGRRLLVAQLELLAGELGQLKGSVMKVGQMLSMYGEHFLPPEANAVLKGLQSQSPPLHFDAIAAALATELPATALASIDIDPVPLAAASLGQVHRATRRADGLQLAVKVQYPGVEAAIAADLRALRRVLGLARLLPRELNTDALFAEIKQMLEQEADYTQELAQTQAFARDLAGDGRYVVPTVLPELSGRHVLTTTFEAGVAVDGPEVAALPQTRRDALGAAVLDLYMREIWQIGRVQTDPHFGNYRVRLGHDGTADQLVVLDFGAVRAAPAEYMRGYADMVAGACGGDRAQVVRGGIRLGLLAADDSPTHQGLFAGLCELICEPFARAGDPRVPAHLLDAAGRYDWGRSDLPQRVARRGAEAVMVWKMRTPPRESIFLDRKLGGVFIFLAVLKARLDGRAILRRYVPLDDGALPPG